MEEIRNLVSRIKGSNGPDKLIVGSYVLSALIGLFVISEGVKATYNFIEIEKNNRTILKKTLLLMQ